MRTKSAQLPASGDGLLVITPPSFLGQPPPTDDLITALQALIAQLPHVVALSLLWRQLAPTAQDEPVNAAGGALLLERRIYPPMIERVLFIPNSASRSSAAVGQARRIMRGPE